MGVELARVYEELVLLHRISTNMRVTESDTNFLQLACDSLTDIVLVEGIAVLLERIVEGDRKLVVAAGSGLIDIDDGMAAALQGRLTEEMSPGPRGVAGQRGGLAFPVCLARQRPKYHCRAPVRQR